MHIQNLRIHFQLKCDNGGHEWLLLAILHTRSFRSRPAETGQTETIRQKTVIIISVRLQSANFRQWKNGSLVDYFLNSSQSKTPKAAVAKQSEA